MKKPRNLPRTLPELVELTTDQLAAVSAGDGCSSGSKTSTVDYSDNMCRSDSDDCPDAIGIGNRLQA